MAEWFTRHSPTFVMENPGDVSTRPGLETYPIPFSESSSIRSESGVIRVYDIAGRLVRSIVTEGPFCTWDGRDEQGRKLPNGVYLYSLGDRTTKTVLASRH
jgi:flagellar hook assembly protein FlgD